MNYEDKKNLYPWKYVNIGDIEYPEQEKEVELLNEMILTKCHYVADNKLTKFVRDETSEMTGKVIAWRYTEGVDCGECTE